MKVLRSLVSPCLLLGLVFGAGDAMAGSAGASSTASSGGATVTITISVTGSGSASAVGKVGSLVAAGHASVTPSGSHAHAFSSSGGPTCVQCDSFMAFGGFSLSC